MTRPERPLSLARFAREIGTQQKLADLLGVHFTTVNTWLRGRRTPRPQMMKKIMRLSQGRVSFNSICSLRKN